MAVDSLEKCELVTKIECTGDQIQIESTNGFFRHQIDCATRLVNQANYQIIVSWSQENNLNCRLIRHSQTFTLGLF